MIKHNKTIIGRTVSLILINNNISIEIIAKVDTGAYSSSISMCLFEKLGQMEETKIEVIKSAIGESTRQFYKLKLSNNQICVESEINLSDRTNMKFDMILGRKDISKFGYIIDPSKKII